MYEVVADTAGMPTISDAGARLLPRVLLKICTVRMRGAAAYLSQRTCRMVCKRPEPSRRRVAAYYHADLALLAGAAPFFFRCRAFFFNGVIVVAAYYHAGITLDAIASPFLSPRTCCACAALVAYSAVMCGAAPRTYLATAGSVFGRAAGGGATGGLGN